MKKILSQLFDYQSLTKMKNTTFFTFLFLFLGIFSAKSANYYVAGDSLWVWATGGLKAHEAPNLTSKTVFKIENGSQIVVLEDKGMDNRSFSIDISKEKKDENGDEIPAFSLNGDWVKVRFNGKEGYVFDGYLMELQTIMPDFSEKTLTKIFGLFDKIDKSVVGIHEGDGEIDQTYIYKNGIVDYIGGSDKGGWGSICIPFDLSLQDGFLIYRQTMLEDVGFVFESVNDDSLVIHDLGLCTTTIKKIGRFLIFEWGCHC
jgi:hypothetical protein